MNIECINIDLFVLFENILFDTLNERKMVLISNIASNLKNIIENKIYLNSILSEHLIFTFTDNFILIHPCHINQNLHHINQNINNVLHQLKYIIFDKQTYEPICYREKTNLPTYLNRCMSDISSFETKEFNNISIYTNYIGSYIILFFHNVWYFVFNNTIYEYNNNIFPVLYEHLNKHIDSFDINLCYHIMLVDKRTRKIISHTDETNYIVLLKTTHKQTLFTTRATYINHNNMEENKRIYMSCLDELIFNLNECDTINMKTNKLVHRGYILVYNNIYIKYDTNLYKSLINIIQQVNKQDKTKHHIHIKLYQQNKLNYLLQYINGDDAKEIIKRIKISLQTISREILDIYHLTRNKNNEAIYNILPYAYKHVLYKLHASYIIQKLNETDEKISITNENIYHTLKSLDYNYLKDIYLYREQLKFKLFGIEMLYTRMCNYTDIECKLLSEYYE